ncbi:MAG: hypothetical protein QG657_5346 [Acidobacteriota bacterium]|nr:hypothetical protein [Acidobacteriota bacterium]
MPLKFFLPGRVKKGQAGKSSKPDGTLRQWDAKGNLVKTEEYQYGILTGIRRY